MIREIVRILKGNMTTLLEDTLDVSAIFVVLVVVLHLPGIFL